MTTFRQELDDALSEYATEHDFTWLNVRTYESDGTPVFLSAFVKSLNFDQLLKANEPKWIEANASFHVYGYSEEDAHHRLSKLVSITLLSDQ
jgi:hypothetical protein